MKKILLILYKEWLEIRQQPVLLSTIILPPLIFTAIVLITVAQIGHVKLVNGPLPSSSSNPLLVGMAGNELTQALAAMQVSVLYLLLPGIITSVIASYSIVGEKTSRTLEPLLATPVKTWELLLGKCLASLIPGIGVTWLGGLVFIIAMSLFSVSSRVFAAVISPGWLILFLVWAPLLAIIAIGVMVAISSRVNEPRTAQQASIWLVVPFLSVFFGQAAGIQVLGPVFTLIVALLLAMFAVITIWAATQFFQRETILTRWK